LPLAYRKVGPCPGYTGTDAKRKEMTMNPRPALARPPIGSTLAAVALSIVVTTLLLVGVTELFTCDGLPLWTAGIAERACTQSSCWSEREACEQSLLAASYHPKVASR
jgi:hypothetical protein